VNTGNLCPTGWHVPSDAEWTVLTDYLGGLTVAGGKLKSTSIWASPNTGATNESGFSAVPTGYRFSSGNFNNMSYTAVFWSSSEQSTFYAWYRSLYFDNSGVTRYYTLEKEGYTVRCIRNY
jgi:uncharacterized protein (TIGR02145 family)